MKTLIYIFYLEVVISLFSAFQAFFLPAGFAQQLAPGGAPPALAVEMARWYGVLLFVLVYLLARGLYLRGEPLKLALQALLIGDILQIWATYLTAQTLGGWSFTLVMSAALSILYLVLRAICLWKPAQTGVIR